VKPWLKITLGVLVALYLLPRLALLNKGLPLRMSGPFRGLVLDAETKAPLAGAVVLAVWSAENFPGTPFHTNSFLAATEVLTDAQGRLAIPWSLRFTLFPLSVVADWRSSTDAGSSMWSFPG
jgi:hypothetical protein